MMCLIVNEAHERKGSPSHLCKLTLAGASENRLTGPWGLNDTEPIQRLGVPLHAVAADSERLSTPGFAGQAQAAVSALAQRIGNCAPW